jgi:hypothetical protein
MISAEAVEAIAADAAAAKVYAARCLSESNERVFFKDINLLFNI